MISDNVLSIIHDMIVIEEIVWFKSINNLCHHDNFIMMTNIQTHFRSIGNYRYHLQLKHFHINYHQIPVLSPLEKNMSIFGLKVRDMEVFAQRRITWLISVIKFYKKSLFDIS